MDQYAVTLWDGVRGARRYRGKGSDRWDLDEAAALAAGLLEDRGATYVVIGNQDAEFRLYHEDIPRDGEHRRWADWFVDAELIGQRWVYRPMADLGSREDAEALVEELGAMHPHITRAWVGMSDGSEEEEYEVTAR